MRKVLLKKFLVCILILMTLCSFLMNIGNIVYADTDTEDHPIGEVSSGVEGLLSNLLSGLIGILTYEVTLPFAAAFIGIASIIGGLAKLGIGDYSGDFTNINPFHILFNKIKLVDINFFDFNVNGTILQFRQAVAGWYYTMRLIASMVLLVILIYLGVRMALTSIATEKAIYKKMLVDWVTSLALLFLLHYIILFIIECNNALVNALENIVEGSEFSGLGNMMTMLELLMFVPDIIMRITALAIYGMMVFQTISFLVSYIKRMFTIGFLIIIAPLITITYSIDKIGDGKAQALNTWLKEFSYNILLQPFQCILYLVFAKITYDQLFNLTWERLTQSNVGVCIFAILSLQFIKEGEKIVKKIFGFGKASTVGDLAVGAALTAGALMKGKDVAKKYGGSVARFSNKIRSSKAAETMGGYLGNTKVGKALKSAKESVNSFKDKIDTSITNALGGGEESQTSDGNSASSTPQRATSNTKLSEQSAKKEEAIKEKAKEQWKAEGNTGEPTKEFIDNVKKSEAQQEKKNIKGATGKLTFGGALRKASGEAILGIRQSVKDNRKDIVGMSLGMFTAGIGLAAGDFGDISKAVAGYGMGKGFMEGMYENSAKELKKQSDAAAQLLANLTGVSDIYSLLANAEVKGSNDLSKATREALKEINKALANFENKDRLVGNFSNIALDKEKAGTLTKQGIYDMINKYGYTGNDAQKQELVDLFSNYGELLAVKTLYSNIQSAEGMEVTRDSLASMIGNKDAIGYDFVVPVTDQSQNGGAQGGSQGGNSGTPSGNGGNGGNGTPTGSGSSTPTETFNYSDIHTEEVWENHFQQLKAEDLKDVIHNELDNLFSYEMIEKSDADQINNKIAELNALLRNFESRTEDRQQIESAIGQDYSEIKAKLSLKMKLLNNNENN